MNAIDQNPKLSLTDLWGPLWNPTQWACFADEGGDGTGTGGGAGDAGGNYDELGDEKEDTEDSTQQSEETQDEKDAKTEQSKQDETVTKEAVDISKDFDKKIDESDESEDDPKGDDKTPSGDDDKGDDDKAAQKIADDKAAREKEEKDDSETDDKVISDGLLERAVTAGFNLTEARSFGSAKALTKTLEIVEKSQASAGDQASDDKTGKTGTENKDDADKKTEFKPFEVKPFEVKFEGEDTLDPEIAKNIKAVNEQGTEQLKAMNEHYSGQFKTVLEQLEKANTQIQGFQNTVNQQGAAKFETEFETMVAGLGNEYEDLVGKGVGKDLDKNGSQMANRNKLIVAMKAIDKTTIDANKELLSQKEVFEQATAMVFSDKTKELATKKVAAKVEARGKQGLNRASGTKGKPLTPHEGAVQASKDFDSKLDAAEG